MGLTFSVAISLSRTCRRKLEATSFFLAVLSVVPRPRPVPDSPTQHLHSKCLCPLPGVRAVCAVGAVWPAVPCAAFGPTQSAVILKPGTSGTVRMGGWSGGQGVWQQPVHLGAPVLFRCPFCCVGRAARQALQSVFR